MPASRTRSATADQGRYRASIALAYLRAAEHVLDEDGNETNLSVVAGLAVLAGIAASDALCIRHLGYYAKGQDHDHAVDVLLETGTPASRKWSQTLKRLIDLKDEAHYGFYSVSKSKATSALRQGRLLVEAAIESFA